MVVFPCRTVRNRTGATIRARMVANLLHRPGRRPASRIRSGNPVPVLPHSQPILLPVFHRGNSYPFSEVHSRNRIRGLAGFELRDLRIKRPVLCPLSYSPAHTRRHDRRICGMRSPSPYGVAEDGVSSTVPIFNRIVDEPAPRPDLRGAAGFEPASASALPFELRPRWDGDQPIPSTCTDTGGAPYWRGHRLGDTGPIGTGIAHRDGIEPPPAVLETAVLPLDHRHIWCASLMGNAPPSHASAYHHDL